MPDNSHMYCIILRKNSTCIAEKLDANKCIQILNLS